MFIGFAIVLLLFLEVSPAGAQEKKNGNGREKLAVMDLEATYGISEDLSYALSDFLRGEIFAQGEYEVVSKADLDALARRKSLQQQAGADCTDTGCLAELGKALGTKYMVYGSISKAGTLYIISLSLLDTVGENAGVLNRINERCTCSEEKLFDTMQQAAAKIMDKGVFASGTGSTAGVRMGTVAVKSSSGTELGNTYTETTTGMEFVTVPGGCFQMGSNSGDSDEQPVHEVCVDDFQIGKYEVTQGQWREVMENNPAKFMNGDNYPIEQVGWADVQDYISKLNRKSGRSFRLPTEAEWEYACRSGGRDEQYCGGNNVDSLAWYKDNSSGSTHQVGTKSPNGLGIYDMSGNVWEWTTDWYDKRSYGKSPRQNPAGPSSGSYRVFRGGGWRYNQGGVRSAVRLRDSPVYRSSGLGFRLVSPGK
ncbi:MAG: formylglycine-generating enzyme family protein [Proteobacteria bacterium]|nr:formylglycine-generating enzyme family protein [Pseudomonadota bacterium]